MSNPSPNRRHRLTPVRTLASTPPRHLRAILFTAAGGLGLLFGATVAVVAMPRTEAVAEAAPVAPPPSPAAPARPAVLEVPSRVAGHSPPVLLVSVETLRAPSIDRDPPAPAAVLAKAPAVKIVPARERPRLAVKRMHDLTRADLHGQLVNVPALSLDRTMKRTESFAMLEAARQATAAGGVTSDPTLVLLDRRTDLAGLPFRRGSACRITPVTARDLAQRADQVKFLDHDQLMTTLSGAKEWLHPERVPALMQVVMTQPEKNRRMLARHLAGIPGPLASEALARIALFDLEPEVRREAITSLEKRPVGEYRHFLLRGFAYPWPIIAEHAAEAIAALKRTETVPALLAMLDSPDPQAPYAKGTGPARFLQEVVRVNHKFNCLMCHPPSFRATDPARASVPPMRESFQQGFGYSATPRKKETFIRADVTYLKQDYSVLLERSGPGILAAEHRYDLFVRERFATSADLTATLIRKQAGPTGQQKAAAFALRELTGQEAGAGGVNWLRFARRELQVARQR